MLKPGMTISDRYEIVDTVGSGGMADVYKARDKRLNRNVAIKVLKPEYSRDKSFVNKFRGEAQSAAGLSHPNIVNVYDVGDDDGLYYIVMELVEGITLKRFIERKGKLDVKEAVGIAIQIAQGMEAAHDNHIIHRDIKPQNIIISRDGKVKVTDFGIAKATNSNTITSNAMGSVHYLSPEQARGGYSDEKSDIYSLGVTIYEMLSGMVPFAGDNTVSVALLHIQGEAARLRDLDQSIPLSVDKIVQKCMQKRPERRYHSASELIADLKRALSNPDGDFVQIPAYSASDSPTINISDDLGRIKNGAYKDNNQTDPERDTAVLADDEEELDSVDTKVEKVLTIGTIAAIVVLALAIIFIVVWFIIPRDKSEDKDNKSKVEASVTPAVPTDKPTSEPTEAVSEELYKFPSVIGYTKDQAIEVIKAKDKKADIKIQEDFSDVFEKDYVINQYPQGGNDAVMGTTVILTVSSGKEAFLIPYVYGLTEAEAKSKLADYNLVAKVDYAYSDSVPKGDVIESNPPKDSYVYSGDEVKIIISKGPEAVKVKVPDLKGLTAEAAKQMLASQGLELGTVDYQSSEYYPKGQISFQDQTVNLEVDKGTAINVIVSTGPADAQTGGDNNPGNNDPGDNDPGNNDPGDSDPGNNNQGGNNGGTGSGIISYYIGTVIIDINPFDYVGDGEAEIIIEVEQDNEGFEIYSETTSVVEFPLKATYESETDSDAHAIMYVDGIPFKIPGESEPHTWKVTFKAVEE
jgi:serine/threonine protein kinase